jgi:putative ABC transport system permease protein
VFSLIADLRFGFRMLAKRPGFTLAAVLTLALGIGASTVVYSWTQAVLFHPLGAAKNSDQLVVAETVMPDGSLHTSSYPDFVDYRAQQHVFTDMIGFELIGNIVRAGKETQGARTWGELVTGNFFEVLGVNAEMGRMFAPDEDSAPAAHPVAVISDGLWRRRFGSDPMIIGKTMDFDRHPFTIIGVAPPEFGGTIVGLAVEFWVPMAEQPVVLAGESLTMRHPTFVHMMGRLKPDVSISQAQANLSTIAVQIAHAYPESSRNTGVHVGPLYAASYGAQSFLRPVLTFLMAAVLMVLLIGCVNIANLLLARALSREREIAIRGALGAGRGRLMQQLISESMLIAFIGGAAGLLAAAWGINLLSLFLPPAHLPFGLEPAFSARVLGFALMLSVAAGVICGIVPALEASKPGLFSALKEGGRTSSMSRGRRRLRAALVISEVSLAVVMMIGAGLLARSFRNLLHASPGFDAENVRLFAFDLRSSGYGGYKAQEFFDQLIEKLRATPGVESATAERWAPMWFSGRGWAPANVEGYTPKPDEFMGIDFNVVASNYFTTMKIPLVSGRDFTERDRRLAPASIIVNETMARRFWPGKDPVGHRVNFDDEWRTVVGVAKDIKYHSMQEEPESFLYMPLLQEGGTDANVLVRTRASTASMIGVVREQARLLDPNVNILESDDVSELARVSLFAQRIAAALATVLGVLGLLLAGLGIYGVISYGVGQRTQEIGIRLALGAQRGDVLRLVLNQGMRPVIAGAVTGIALGFGAARLLTNQLYGVQSNDPFTFAVVTAILCAVAILACWFPARRATRVDPMVALRHE